MSYTLTLAERETILRFSDDPDDYLSLETFNKKHALRLIREGAEVKRTNTRGNATYWTLKLPKAWFRWPRRTSEKAVLASRAQALRAMEQGIGIFKGRGPAPSETSPEKPTK